jgi:hypothetical protein
MPVQYAKFSRRSDACSTDEGALAARWFGLSAADLEAQAGRFTKGKNKGKLRGWVVFVKCTEGGWVRGLQGVVKPGMIFARFAKTYDEQADLVNLPLERFFAGARRVDSAYGHTPDLRKEELVAQDERVGRARKMIAEQLVGATEAVKTYEQMGYEQCVTTLKAYIAELQEVVHAGDEKILAWFTATANNDATRLIERYVQRPAAVWGGAV